MNMKSVLGCFFAIGMFLVLITGCSTISVETKQNIAAPNYPPSNPAAVQILQAPPIGSYVRLGEIHVTVEGEPTKAAIQEKFRNAASKIGAHAVVILSDRIVVLSTYISGPWWGREASPITGRLIIGDAIRLAQ